MLKRLICLLAPATINSYSLFIPSIFRFINMPLGYSLSRDRDFLLLTISFKILVIRE
jgi:hypothetical protein